MKISCFFVKKSESFLVKQVVNNPPSLQYIDAMSEPNDKREQLYWSDHSVTEKKRKQLDNAHLDR